MNNTTGMVVAHTIAAGATVTGTMAMLMGRMATAATFTTHVILKMPHLVPTAAVGE